ncbi:insulin receptor substrate 1 [Caerostris darwini]|uniref:Insulin receptor substrate 1 n=1 Tax=Caerostris darwini TaxID=1538125 RepID=A0AAV4W029_9ARAC|nr:insulin receptor substrate 1 [Caerostris darwini]
MSQKYKSFSRTSDRSLDCNVTLPPGVKRMGYLRKLKKMKRRFFVLHTESNYGVARLEYYSSEKKWKYGCEPRRCIELKSCLNISRKLHSKHKNAIILYTQDDCFQIVTENAEELELWLNDLLEIQRSFVEIDENAKGRHIYEHLWQVVIDRHDLEYDRLLIGSYRVALSSKSLFLINMNPINDNDYFEFPLMSIRRCGHSKDHFFIELGRSSVIGAGEIYMATEDNIIAKNMHETVLSAMKSSKIREDGNPFPRPRSASTSENSNPVTTKRPIGIVAPQTVSSSVSSCGLSNSRERCDSLPTRPNTITGNPHNYVHSAFSSPYTTSGTTCRRFNSRPHSIFSPGSLSNSTAYSSSTEEVDKIKHQPMSHYSYPLSSDGKLSSDRPITEVPDEYLKMSLNEGKKSADKSTARKSADVVLKKNDYIDMQASSLPKSDSVKKHGNYITVPSGNNTLGQNKDGYLDMSPSNSFSKDNSFNFITDGDAKPYELDKVLSLVKMDENAQNIKECAVKCKPTVMIKEKDADPITLRTFENTNSNKLLVFKEDQISPNNKARIVDTKPPLPERTYRKNEQKSNICPPLPMRKPGNINQNIKQNCYHLQNSNVLGEQSKQDLPENMQTENCDEDQDVFYNSIPCQNKPDIIASPDQNTNFSCLCSNDESYSHSLPCTQICSANYVSSNMKQATSSENEQKEANSNYIENNAEFSKSKNICDNSEVQTHDLKNAVFSQSASNSLVNDLSYILPSTRTKSFHHSEDDYVNIEIKKSSTASNHIAASHYVSKQSPLLVPNCSDSNDPSYSNIQFGKPICPTPKPVPASIEAVFSAISSSLKADRNFMFSCSSATDGAVGQKVLRSPTGTLNSGSDLLKCSILAPRFRNIPNTLPTFRKQMSAPAAPLSLRPELPSPGRKSSCPVTGSASMVRSSAPGTSISPMRAIHLQSHGVPNVHLRVSTSRSPDHSSVSSISSASDEISSTHSSPKTSTASQNFNRQKPSESQYENVVIPQRSSTSSRPPSTSSEEKELNYALLDLPSSMNDEVPRSPLVQKSPVPDDEITLTYAEIDFTKSEGLKNITGIVRDGRL